MTRTCENCGEPINLRRSHARTCSTRCRVAVSRAKARAAAREPFPPAMVRSDRWVRRDARKRPLRADTGRLASVVDQNTWTSYATAGASPVGVGLGWVLGEGIGCIDLDHCLRGGELAPWAAEVIDQHRAKALLIEVSQSGEGVHIFLPMEPGPGSVVRDGRRYIETYPPGPAGRYIAVTGRSLGHSMTPGC